MSSTLVMIPFTVLIGHYNSCLPPLFPLQRRKTLCSGRCVWTRATCSPSSMTCCTSWTRRSCTSLRRSRLPRTSWTVCLRSQESRVRRPARRCWTQSTATSQTCYSGGGRKTRIGTWMKRNVSVKRTNQINEAGCLIRFGQDHCVTWFEMGVVLSLSNLHW